MPAHRAGHEREVRPEPALPEDPAAARIVQASIAGTVVFAVTAVPAAIAPDAFVGVAVIVSWCCSPSAWSPSRGPTPWPSAAAAPTSSASVACSSSPAARPAACSAALIGSLVAEIVIAVATASTRVYTPLAFGVLVPMYGLGLMGLWGARLRHVPAPRPTPTAAPSGWHRRRVAVIR